MWFPMLIIYISFALMVFILPNLVNISGDCETVKFIENNTEENYNLELDKYIFLYFIPK